MASLKATNLLGVAWQGSSSGMSYGRVSVKPFKRRPLKVSLRLRRRSGRVLCMVVRALFIGTDIGKRADWASRSALRLKLVTSTPNGEAICAGRTFPLEDGSTGSIRGVDIDAACYIAGVLTRALALEGFHVSLMSLSVFSRADGFLDGWNHSGVLGGRFCAHPGSFFPFHEGPLHVWQSASKS